MKEAGLSDEQLEALLLPDTSPPEGVRLPDGSRIEYSLAADESREACRALKGSILRQEIYALDGTEEEDRPYSASERNYTVELLQPREGNKHAVFFTHPRETIDFHYERKLINVLDGKLVDEATAAANPNAERLADPRVSHAMTLEVDQYGNVERSVAIAYPRRALPGSMSEQEQTHITLTVNRFANYPDEQDWYRVGLPVESRTFEIVNPPEPAVAANSAPLLKIESVRRRLEELFPLTGAEPEVTKTIPYEKWDWRTRDDTHPDARLRLIEHVRTLYYQDDLSGPKPLGQAERLAIPYESYKLAFTPALLDSIYNRARNGAQENLLSDQGRASVLRDEGGYVLSDDYRSRGWFPATDPDGHFWIPSGQQVYSPVADIPKPPMPPEPLAQDVTFARKHFFLPQGTRDPFGALTRIEYDSHDLLLKKTTDPMGNVVTLETTDADGKTVVANDYRVLQPRLITDPNGNRSEVRFDALGMVVGTAVMGKVSEPDGKPKGDLFTDDFEPDLTQSEINSFFEEPKERAADLLRAATTRIVYDLDRGFTRQMEYDLLQRPTHLYVSGNGWDKALAEKTVYGDDQERGPSDPEDTNHRGKVYQVYDSAGVVTSDRYDFKGNLVRSTRKLRTKYKDQVDWKTEPSPEGKVFTSASRFDALNRVIQSVAPHHGDSALNITQPVYNEANLLVKVDVWWQLDSEPLELLDPDTANLHAVTNVDYNAKGQRELIVYGNSARTRYEYDPLTFHLTKLTTTRPAGLNGFALQIFADPSVVQDL